MRSLYTVEGILGELKMVGEWNLISPGIKSPPKFIELEPPSSNTKGSLELLNTQLVREREGAPPLTVDATTSTVDHRGKFHRH